MNFENMPTQNIAYLVTEGINVLRKRGAQASLRVVLIEDQGDTVGATTHRVYAAGGDWPFVIYANHEVEVHETLPRDPDMFPLLNERRRTGP